MRLSSICTATAVVAGAVFAAGLTFLPTEGTPAATPAHTSGPVVLTVQGHQLAPVQRDGFTVTPAPVGPLVPILPTTHSTDTSAAAPAPVSPAPAAPQAPAPQAPTPVAPSSSDGVQTGRGPLLDPYALVCAIGEEAMPVGELGYICGPADKADPTHK